MTAARFDLITMGRVGVDLYPQQVGVGLAEVESFSKSLGGSPTNVAVAAARFGAHAAVVTKVGKDPFGDYIRKALREFGVAADFVSSDPALRTPLALCEVHPPDHFPLLFYRQPKAPDMNLGYSDLPLEEIVGCRLFWTTGVGLSEEPSRSATLAALEARSAGAPGGERAPSIHDLDYRPMLWSDPGEARALALRAVRGSTVVVGNTEEVEMATGTADPERASAALLEAGAQIVVVKRGGDGVEARTAAGDRVSLPAVTVEVVNGLGAGDAFGGALCHGLLQGWELERTLRFANAAGALVASRMRCADDMPSAPEVEALLERARD